MFFRKTVDEIDKWGIYEEEERGKKTEELIKGGNLAKKKNSGERFWRGEGRGGRLIKECNLAEKYYGE